MTEGLDLPRVVTASETLQQGSGSPRNALEKRTFGFRMLGLSQTRRAVLVVVVEGCGLSSVRSGGAGDPIYDLLPPPGSLPFSRGRGMGV